MASIFGHAFSALAFGAVMPGEQNQKKFILSLGTASAMLPDIDMISFKLGIPYEHMFGHRGFSHSIFFAIIWSYLLSILISNMYKGNRVHSFIYIFVCTLSHGIFDAMTTGGRGIAFFAPFSEERFFFPWRIIQVSPIHISDFFGPWGWSVLKSELYWIVIPGCLFILFASRIKKLF